MFILESVSSVIKVDIVSESHSSSLKVGVVSGVKLE